MCSWSVSASLIQPVARGPGRLCSTWQTTKLWWVPRYPRQVFLGAGIRSRIRTNTFSYPFWSPPLDDDARAKFSARARVAFATS